MNEQIRERIDGADNKEKLEAIGRELEPAVELDRRKNMDVLRAELHAHLDDHGQQGASSDGGQDSEATNTEGDGQSQGDTQHQESSQPEKTAQTVSGGRPKGYKGRLLQNMKTGVFFPWTAELAKKRNMREV